MSDHVFPEDSGTGAAQGDWSDAANFAQLARAVGAIDYVVSGMGFTYDNAVPDVDIAAGVAVVTDSSATATNTSETRTNVSYVVEADARTAVSLTDSAVNHIFLDVDLSSDDTISYHVDTDNTPPADPYLKIGEIDTTADTTDEQNREPTFNGAVFTSDVYIDTSFIEGDGGTFNLTNDGPYFREFTRSGYAFRVQDDDNNTVFDVKTGIADNGEISGLFSGGTGISNITGDGLEIDGSGNLNATGSGRFIHDPETELADSSQIDIPITVQDGKTLEVDMWGAREPDGTSPAGLTVELLDESKVSQSSESTAFNTGSPIASLANSSGSNSIYYLSVVNATGNNYTSGNAVEAIQYEFKARVV